MADAQRIGKRELYVNLSCTIIEHNIENACLLCLVILPASLASLTEVVYQSEDAITIGKISR